MTSSSNDIRQAHGQGEIKTVQAQQTVEPQKIVLTKVQIESFISGILHQIVPFLDNRTSWDGSERREHLKPLEDLIGLVVTEYRTKIDPIRIKAKGVSNYLVGEQATVHTQNPSDTLSDLQGHFSLLLSREAASPEVKRIENELEDAYRAIFQDMIVRPLRDYYFNQHIKHKRKHDLDKKKLTYDKFLNLKDREDHHNVSRTLGLILKKINEIYPDKGLFTLAQIDHFKTLTVPRGYKELNKGVKSSNKDCFLEDLEDWPKPLRSADKLKLGVDPKVEAGLCAQIDNAVKQIVHFYQAVEPTGLTGSRPHTSKAVIFVDSYLKNFVVASNPSFLARKNFLEDEFDKLDIDVTRLQSPKKSAESNNYPRILALLLRCMSSREAQARGEFTISDRYQKVSIPDLYLSDNHIQPNTMAIAGMFQAAFAVLPGGKPAEEKQRSAERLTDHVGIDYRHEGNWRMITSEQYTQYIFPVITMHDSWVANLRSQMQLNTRQKQELLDAELGLFQIIHKRLGEAKEVKDDDGKSHDMTPFFLSCLKDCENSIFKFLKNNELAVPQKSDIINAYIIVNEVIPEMVDKEVVERVLLDSIFSAVKELYSFHQSKKGFLGLGKTKNAAEMKELSDYKIDPTLPTAVSIGFLVAKLEEVFSSRVPKIDKIASESSSSLITVERSNAEERRNIMTAKKYDQQSLRDLHANKQRLSEELALINEATEKDKVKGKIARIDKVIQGIQNQSVVTSAPVESKFLDNPDANLKGDAVEKYITFLNKEENQNDHDSARAIGIILRLAYYKLQRRPRYAGLEIPESYQEIDAVKFPALSKIFNSEQVVQFNFDGKSRARQKEEARLDAARSNHNTPRGSGASTPTRTPGRTASISSRTAR